MMFGGTTSTLPAFNNANNAQSQEKFSEFVKQVAGEMTTWEKTGLWQLSVLCPMKDYPLVQGFEDTSPEELRVVAYSARSNAEAQQKYQNVLSEKMSRHKQLRDALRSGTGEALQMLKEIFYGQKRDSSNDPQSPTSSLFAKPQTPGGFGSPATMQQQPLAIPNATSAFGGASQQTTGSLFGGASGTSSSSVFGAAKPVNSVFGTSQSNQPGSLFGGMSTDNASVFGGNGGNNSNNTTSVFGAANNSTATLNTNNSVFSSVSGGVSRNLFGGEASAGNVAAAATAAGGTSVFGSQGNSATFGSTGTTTFGGSGAFSSNTAFGGGGGTNNANTSQQSTSLFGGSSTSAIDNNNTASVFGGLSSNTQQQSSVFGGGANTTQQSQPTNMSVFGGQANVASTNPSLFGVNPQQTSVFGTNSNSVFGGSSVEHNTNILGNTTTGVLPSSAATPADPSDERYTPMDKLSDEDRCQYQAEIFAYVPFVPPPRELCF